MGLVLTLADLTATKLGVSWTNHVVSSSEDGRASSQQTTHLHIHTGRIQQCIISRDRCSLGTLLGVTLLQLSSNLALSSRKLSIAPRTNRRQAQQQPPRWDHSAHLSWTWSTRSQIAWCAFRALHSSRSTAVVSRSCGCWAR